MTNLLSDPKRLGAAKTFLMVPLWDDRADRIKGKCEHCGCEVAWDPQSAAMMQELNVHLLCPGCTHVLFDVLGSQVERLGRLDGGILRQ